jgi:RHS repeat-associated protein
MLSSVLQLAGSTGLVANNYNYDAWGQATNWPNPTLDPNPYGYTGREWEGVNSYYYRHRVYTPSVASFLSKDPMSRMVDYLYCSHNPLLHKDPTGLFNDWMWPVNVGHVPVVPPSAPAGSDPKCVKCPGGHWDGFYFDETLWPLTGGENAGGAWLFCNGHVCKVHWVCIGGGPGFPEPGEGVGGLGMAGGIGFGYMGVWWAYNGGELESGSVNFVGAGGRYGIGGEGSLSPDAAGGTLAATVGVSFGVGGNVGIAPCHVFVDYCVQ